MGSNISPERGTLSVEGDLSPGLSISVHVSSHRPSPRRLIEWVTVYTRKNP